MGLLPSYQQQREDTSNTRIHTHTDIYICTQMGMSPDIRILFGSVYKLIDEEKNHRWVETQQQLHTFQPWGDDAHGPMDLRVVGTPFLIHKPVAKNVSLLTRFRRGWMQSPRRTTSSSCGPPWSLVGLVSSTQVWKIMRNPESTSFSHFSMS